MLLVQSLIVNAMYRDGTLHNDMEYTVYLSSSQELAVLVLKTSLKIKMTI